MKPIIFSAPMIRAILAGHKTMTRRPIIPQPVGEIRQDTAGDYGEDYGGGVLLLKPPFKPGDVLYVRETWANLGWDNYIYKADDLKRYEHYQKWRPSIHMPREAARIFLKVTDVSINRLHVITPKDAIAEGIQHKCGDCTECEGESAGNDCTDYRLAFSKLWDSIYAKKPEYKWDMNPWVWVISFERTEATK